MDPAVGLVSAYLELCGYFVLAELPVRQPEGGGFRDVTDVDIVAVRFPHLPAVQIRDSYALLLGSDSDLQSFASGVDVIVGEVKEGSASINPALRRESVIAFVLHRLNCCPPEQILSRAQSIATTGSAEMEMAPGLPCRLRMVVFAGKGSGSAQAAMTLSLEHCAEFVQGRLRAAEEGLQSAHWKDPTLGLLALLEKIKSG